MARTTTRKADVATATITVPADAVEKLTALLAVVGVTPVTPAKAAPKATPAKKAPAKGTNQRALSRKSRPAFVKAAKKQGTADFEGMGTSTIAAMCVEDPTLVPKGFKIGDGYKALYS